ncbi:MAG: hypothetical protein ACOZBH_03715 [Patescibacteria group bacterium]
MDISWKFSWLDVIILLVISFIVIMAILIFKKRPPEEVDVEKIKKKWNEIEDLISKDNETMWRVAVIEADKLLDFALKGMIMPGENMGQRLKYASGKYPKIQQVWWAHKLRNNLVHEHDIKLRKGEAAKAVKAFERALKVLNVL